MNGDKKSHAPDAADVGEVRGLLDAAGLKVEAVPEASESRCDLKATDGVTRYFVEVKGFHDNESIHAALTHGEPYSAARGTLHLGTVDERISKALEQLAKTDASDSSSLRLVALFPRTRFGTGVTYSQITGTLYGEQDILYVDGAGQNQRARCLYFRESVFFRHRMLDGAIVFDPNGGAGFHVNDHGLRVETVKASGLAKWFARHGGLSDAKSLESAGGFFIADCALSRKDPAAIRNYLCKKYRLSFCMDFQLNEYSAMSKVR